MKTKRIRTIRTANIPKPLLLNPEGFHYNFIPIEVQTLSRKTPDIHVECDWIQQMCPKLNALPSDNLEYITLKPTDFPSNKYQLPLAQVPDFKLDTLVANTEHNLNRFMEKADYPGALSTLQNFFSTAGTFAGIYPTASPRIFQKAMDFCKSFSLDKIARELGADSFSISIPLGFSLNFPLK